MAADHLTWLPARKNFLLPVKALSKIFRAKFLHGLRNTPLFARIPPKVWQQDWVVHCKPVGNGRTALEYLAPYIFRVALPKGDAISNRRLIKLENGQVTFRYRTSDTGQLKFCTLSAEEPVLSLSKGSSIASSSTSSQKASSRCVTSASSPIPSASACLPCAKCSYSCIQITTPLAKTSKTRNLRQPATSRLSPAPPVVCP